MANSLMHLKTVSFDVPSSPSRLLTAPSASYLMVQSVVVSSHESTAPAFLRAWLVEADATTGSMPDSMHLAYGAIGPRRDAELLCSSCILQPGESIAIEQEGDSYSITAKIFYSAFSPGIDSV